MHWSRGNLRSTNRLLKYVQRKKSTCANRLIVKIIIVILTSTMCQHANRKLEVAALTRFRFKLLRDTSNIVGVFKTQNTTSTQQVFVIHVSKESTPIVPFGGVGQIVGEIARGQTKTFTTAVILPHYGFITNTQALLKFEFWIRGTRVQGSVHYLKHGDAFFFFIGPPSHISKLWQSTHIEDAYAQPRTLLHKIKAYTTDLYFSFVAAQLVSYISAHQSIVQESCFVAHVHGGSNAPTLWFLRQLSPDISTIYTVHDYNREPFITYPVESVRMYAQKVSTKREEIYMCDMDNPRLSTSVLLNTRNRLSAAHFASCANVVTTVSEGMVTELKTVNEYYAEQLRRLSNRGRITTVHNWLSAVSWKRAREAVSAEQPLNDKLKARLKLFSDFKRFLIGTHHQQITSNECVVLWIGRFEINKGVLLLPALHKSSCNMGCAFVIFGHWTNNGARNLYERVLSKIERQNSRCTTFAFKDRPSQERGEQTVRSAADFVVIPSYSEAYGFVAAEALAYASVPIVSSVGGLTEIINPFNESCENALWTGFIFSIDDQNIELSINAAQSTLRLAVETVRMMNSSSRKVLLQRLIRNAPIGTGGLEAYNSFVRASCALMPLPKSM